MGTSHASIAILVNSTTFSTEAQSSAGHPLSNQMSLQNPCSYLPHPQLTNRASTTTEKITSWTRGSCSHCVIREELLFVEMLWVWGCRPWSDNTTNCVVARLTVDKSLNQTYFCFFRFVLSNKYLCTILVLFSFLLIIELPTLVTWCHLVIIGCQCPQCGFTMQLSFWTSWWRTKLDSSLILKT